MNYFYLNWNKILQQLHWNTYYCWSSDRLIIVQSILINYQLTISAINYKLIAFYFKEMPYGMSAIHIILLYWQKISEIRNTGQQ